MTSAVPLIRVGGTKDTKATGVSSPPGHWPRGFIAKGKSKTKQVFQRRGRTAYPLDVVKIKVRDIVERSLRKGANDAIQVVAKRLPVELAHEWRQRHGSR